VLFRSAAQIDHDFPDRADAPPLWLIGALKGAFVLTADLARAIRRECRIDFVEAKSYGQGTEPSGEPRVSREPEGDLAGCDVLLVEDILDTGRTSERLLALLASKRPRRKTVPSSIWPISNMTIHHNYLSFCCINLISGTVPRFLTIGKRPEAFCPCKNLELNCSLEQKPPIIVS